MMVAAEESIPKATFAGGNFWYLQHEFDKTFGVMHTKAGYSGGVSLNPTYKTVSSGTTKHVETVQMVYDPSLISYEDLLDIYFANIDPTDTGGQFCHRGSQYLPKIFYHNDAQKEAAEHRVILVQSRFRNKDVVVQVLPYTIFYPAEEQYQLYYERRPFFVSFMEFRCGRKKGLKKLWDD